MRLLQKLTSMHLQKLTNCSSRVRHLRQQLMLWSIAWSRPRLFSETSFICLLPVLMAVDRSWSGSWTDSVFGPAFEPDDLLDWSWPLCDCRLNHKERELSIELSRVKFGLYSECLTKLQKRWLQTSVKIILIQCAIGLQHSGSSVEGHYCKCGAQSGRGVIFPPWTSKKSWTPALHCTALHRTAPHRTVLYVVTEYFFV